MMIPAGSVYRLRGRAWAIANDGTKSPYVGTATLVVERQADGVFWRYTVACDATGTWYHHFNETTVISVYTASVSTMNELIGGSSPHSFLTFETPNTRHPI